MKRVLLLLAALSTSVSAQRPNPAAAPQAPPPVQSPDVQPDRRVTFRLRAPNAREVAVTREGAPRLAMQKDDQGIWSVTTEPLEPDLYGYSFVADGARLLDSSNPLIKTNLLNPSSIVHVPGPASLPWEVADVPHGIVHHHYYKSGVVGDQRDLKSVLEVSTPFSACGEARLALNEGRQARPFGVAHALLLDVSAAQPSGERRAARLKPRLTYSRAGCHERRRKARGG